MAVIWGGSVYERIRQGMETAWYNTGKNMWSSQFWSLSARVFLVFLVCLKLIFPLQFLSLNATYFTFVFCASLPLPCHHALILIFLCSSTPFFSSNPLFLKVILSSRPSFFYSCCQISLSTPGKLHFSDYTPIKGPIGTLFACCILSLETEKCTVSVRVGVCVCACAQQRELSKILAAEKSICVCSRMSNRRRQPPAKSLLMILFTLVARLIKV